MAILTKRKNTFDVYELELSYTELMAIQAMGETSGDPVTDELSKSIQWYLSSIVPPPGVDEHPSKASKDDPEIDELLPDGAEVEATPPGAGADMLPAPHVDSVPPGDDEEITVEKETERLLPAPAR